jgi:RNA polymerase sigma-70 factor (ECF subfamily)
MNHATNAYSIWLADYYLLSASLVAFALVTTAFLRQPAHRLTIIKSTLLAALLLAALCALPGWSVIHLLTTESPLPVATVHFAPATPANIHEPVREKNTEAAPTIQFERAQSAPAEVRSPVPPIQISWPAVFITLHLAGAAAITIWLFIGWLASRHLRGTAGLAPQHITSMLQEVINSAGARLPCIDVLTHDRVNIAVALGIWHPTILLPLRWVANTQIPLPCKEGQGEGSDPSDNNSSTPTHLRTVLAHETTHILNHDLHWLALTRVLSIVLWANPLFWLIKRRLRLDQEALADAAAADLTSRHEYAEQLVAWARDLSHQPALQLSSAVGLWEGPSQLSQRIAILLNDQLQIFRTTSRRLRLSATTLALIAAAVLSLVTLQPASRADEKNTNAALKTTTEKLLNEPSAAPQRPAADRIERLKPNTITGRAVDENKQPVAGAEVFLFRLNRIDASRKLVAQKTTGADGRFEFDNVIDITREFPGGKLTPFNPQEEEFIQLVVRSPKRATGSQMDIRQRIARDGEFLEISLPPAARLTGRVTGPDGKPVAGALVSRGGSGFTAWERAQSARTDADGRYEITDSPAFSLAKYREQEAKQRNRLEALRSKSNRATADYSIFIMPPALSVTHPDFATKYTTHGDVPGTQDVTLQPAAAIDGRVVFGDSKKPATGALVHLQTMRPNPTLPTPEQAHSVVHAEARTDADGKYRFANLPPGHYDLSVELPDWVNAGIDNFDAPAGNTATAPDLVLTSGGVVSTRLVDANTKKPLDLKPTMTADISAHKFPFGRVSRPAWKSFAAANPAGRFELHSPPGKRAILVLGVRDGDELKYAGQSPADPPLTIDVVEGKTHEIDIPVTKLKDPKDAINGAVFITQPPPTEEPAKEDQGAVKRSGLQNGGEIRLVQSTTRAPERMDVKRPPGLLGYGDDKPDGKKSIGGSGEMIRFELPAGVTKIKGIRIHGSRYGLPQAPKEDFEITFLNEKRDETLHAEAAPYRLFNRGKEQWVRVAFKNEVELPRKFWVCLNFNAQQTKGVYVSYDTSTKGEYSRVGLPGDKDEPKETDFKGDWMVQLLLAKSPESKREDVR